MMTSWLQRYTDDPAMMGFLLGIALALFLVTACMAAMRVCLDRRHHAQASATDGVELPAGVFIRRVPKYSSEEYLARVRDGYPRR
jgi:hypothetical protein